MNGLLFLEKFIWISSNSLQHIPIPKQNMSTPIPMKETIFFFANYWVVERLKAWTLCCFDFLKDFKVFYCMGVPQCISAPYQYFLSVSLSYLVQHELFKKVMPVWTQHIARSSKLCCFNSLFAYIPSCIVTGGKNTFVMRHIKHTSWVTFIKWDLISIKTGKIKASKWYLIIENQSWTSEDMRKTRFIFPFIFFILSKTFYIISNNWQNRQEVCFDVTSHIFTF